MWPLKRKPGLKSTVTEKPSKVSLPREGPKGSVCGAVDQREAQCLWRRNQQLEEENNLLWLKVDILLDMLSETTAESHLMEKELDELRSPSLPTQNAHARPARPEDKAKMAARKVQKLRAVELEKQKQSHQYSFTQHISLNNKSPHPPSDHREQ
ncbi:hypothetical protein MC885_020788 [Smutsia gigantea]|nr:hypothetical protein MC885_020788 [Smutsia gigantea]